MAIKDLATLTKYIESLELAEPSPEIRGLQSRRTPAPEPTDGEAGYVDAGALVSFVAGISPLHKSDVLNSVLLAQLAADKLFNRESATKDWYGKFVEVLTNVGWVAQNFGFKELKSAGTNFEVNKLVVEMLAAISSGPALSAISLTLSTLKALAEKQDSKWKVYSSQSYNGKEGNFQIGCAAAVDGVPVMSFGAFTLSSSQSSDQYLWFNFSSSSSNFWYSTQATSLAEDIYSQVRELVIKKLGVNAATYILDLEI
jgi:hypothetical protein